MNARGDYIGGRFVSPEGEPLVSINPAREGAIVLETAWSPGRMTAACDAAAGAAAGWAELTLDQRVSALGRFQQALSAKADQLADAIVLETGKLRSEARVEIAALLSRFDLARQAALKEVASGPLPGYPSEQMRFHPLGVVGVIGPFNYPLHLCHAYAIPALLMGNAVVIKPSEIAPLSAQRYAEAIDAAKLPAGIVNVVHGRGAAGEALAAHPAVRGLCFTGSYGVGRRIRERAIDRPELLVALEMGGKNTAIVLDDADVRQAAHEIAVGGYLTTGQRCTATDRVLVHRSRRGELVDALRAMVKALRFGDPDDGDSFAGPLATEAGKHKLLAALSAARSGGAEAIVDPAPRDSRFFVDGSLHLLPDGVHEIPGYTDVELFGPDVGIETFDDDDEAIAVVNASPYAFANSVFSGDDVRFERFYRLTMSGILNRNRSTNEASPRLPFGGFRKSGNYRPGGAHAVRHVVAPVAVQENVLGRVTVHPKLVDHMPQPELSRMAARHAAEEAVEAKRTLLATPRPLKRMLPKGGRLPQSEHWLTRLYAGERIVREKKPPVFDHLRSHGPWYVSIDDDPLSVLDGMSQTATMCGGFAAGPVVRGYIEGAFGDSLVSTYDITAASSREAQDLATALRHLVPGMPHVSFTNSGAEANEKALALCRLNASRRDASKVLAFEGCFHGRTLLALHATHNPSKRQPFEIRGYEATFAPFPVWAAPSSEQPAAPSGFYAAAGIGDIDSLTSRFGDADEDSLLAAEVAALAAVHQALSTEQYFACIVEPMQSEGGDRYATARFFKALRLLTRHHDVPLVLDEVQTGYALGGNFAWHSDYRLVNRRGQPDYPDAVTFAKRAQVGVCMSRFEDPEPTCTQPASLIRGSMHAEMMSTEHSADRIERLVKPRLAQMAQAFPDLVSEPRAQGYSFAFDLPTPAMLEAYLGQRFWRGAIVYGAGSRTVRYRLSEGFLAREIDLLFETVRRSLSWLDAHPNLSPPAWEDSSQPAPATKAAPRIRIRTAPPEEAVTLLAAILDIEYRVYEPARRTPSQDIRAGLADAEGVTSVAEVELDGEWQFVGFGIGQPLERAAAIEEGPDRDPMLGRHNTLYSLSITVSPEYQNLGIGRMIKEHQLGVAAERRTADGKPRYRYVSSRNRVGRTARMRHLNDAFGAHLVCVLTGQYEDPEGQAIYSRIPLPPIAPDPSLRRPGGATAGASIDLSQGISRPLAEPPQSLVEAERSGLLYGPAVNKITLMNFVTPAVVRALEWANALLPRLPHMYLTSSRDECADKAIRICRFHRAKAGVALGFVGGYLGHTTGAARSLSDPAVHRMGPPHFAWPRVAHPADVGVDASIEQLRAAIAAAGGADAVLGLFFEMCQERTGRVFPAAFWPAIKALRRETGIPLVAAETSTACFRSGLGPFAVSGAAISPDIVMWWGGAQTGYLHVSSELRVAPPLTLVSTWDGDELSMVREHHQLRAAREIDLGPAIAAMDRALDLAAGRGLPARGLGLYRVLDAGERADSLALGLEERGLTVRRFRGGRLAISPPLDRAREAAERLERALEEILR